MARNLARAGHTLTVYNRTRSRAAEVAEGAFPVTVAASPAAAAREAEIAITMLADDRAVESVVLDPDGILETLGHNAIHISMSTISVALSKRLAEVHAKHDSAYLAAPVFGRPEAAAAAKLWIVAAGEAPRIERCRPLFEAMGRGISIIPGEPWRANVVKLCGNFLIASMLESLGEAYALARKCGIDPHQLLDVANSALFNSPLYASYGGRVADEAYEPAGFRLKLGLKDVNLALDAAEAESVPLPVASLLRDRLLTAVANGLGESDWSAMAEIAAQSAGLSRRAHG